MQRLALLLAVLTVLAGCTTGVPVDAPSDSGDGGATVDSGAVTVEVIRVVDGDTVKIAYENGTEDTVRLLGVDTPEVHAENTPDEFEGVPETAAGRDCLRAWGEKASAYAKQTLAGEQVTLEFDATEGPRGYYGRLLAYVVVDGEPFNYGLVENGYARVYDSSFERKDRFYEAEAAAQQEGRGLWGACATAHPSASAATPTATTASENGLRIAITADAPGNDNENLDAETVTLTNTRDTAIDLEGWTVSDESGKTYTFPAMTLDSGASVTLHSGAGEDTTTDVYWGRSGAVWNNGGDTVTVRDDGGAVVAAKSY
ncbi:thermonuclease family protein [Natronomonas sp. EA1]|uniref:thermonuclease family protein n=1 Tax=Natronomonas sp. EA1 TaxID=3421655 RepID=UPI003EB9A069